MKRRLFLGFLALAFALSSSAQVFHGPAFHPAPGGGPSLVGTPVVRYYVDEAASGTGPTAVVDRSGNSYDLTTINYGAGNMAYAEPAAGMRALDSISVNGTQRAMRAIDNTSDAVRDALAGVTQATIELVLRLDAGNSNGGRVFGINDRAGSDGELIVKAPNDVNTALNLSFNDVSSPESANIGTARVVVHIVLDSTQGTATNRIRVYINGALDLTGIGDNVGLNETLALAADLDLIAFNRDSGGSFDRSFDGALFYAAIYAEAFTQQMVTDNFDILTLDDDQP